MSYTRLLFIWICFPFVCLLTGCSKHILHKFMGRALIGPEYYVGECYEVNFDTEPWEQTHKLIVKVLGVGKSKYRTEEIYMVNGTFTRFHDNAEYFSVESIAEPIECPDLLKKEEK